MDAAGVVAGETTGTMGVGFSLVECTWGGNVQKSGPEVYSP